MAGWSSAAQSRTRSFPACVGRRAAQVQNMSRPVLAHVYWHMTMHMFTDMYNDMHQRSPGMDRAMHKEQFSAHHDDTVRALVHVDRLGV